MGQFIFPTEFVFWTKNPTHKTNKAQLLQKIAASLEYTKEKQTEHWLCDVNTGFFSYEDDVQKYMRLCTDSIYPALDQMFAEIPHIKTPRSSKITKIWYNHYGPNGVSGQEVHTHVGHGNSYSGIYLLSLLEPNTTVFYSHLASCSMPGAINAAFQTRFAQEGDILLFPSALMHYVLPAKTPRTTIAFNVECTY